MELKIFRTLWGYPGNTLDAVTALKGSRFEGIEGELPVDRAAASELAAAIRDGGFGFIPLIPLEAETPGGQLEEFRDRLDQASALEADRIVMHSGRDWWPLEESIEFYRRIVEIEAALGFRAAHETHRGRPLATPWDTARILTAVPELRLCCDFSHWVLVCERLLDDQADAVNLAASRADHLHARLGTEQAPQVRDPSRPELADHLRAFESWWDEIWRRQRASGQAISTMCPEYGPPPYQPFADHPRLLPEELEAACTWQADRCFRRFSSTGAGI
ncbi:MAG: TIM barrel protein [Actinobacteria bacterium]|nr:TIM barrel protein [Actinomycetota bacterium]